MRLDAAIADATARLAKHSDSPRLDGELLLCRAINMPRSYLFSHPEDELDELALARLNALLERRSHGEPMAYITGQREFWSLDLVVSPATLVPRPETELLVDLALRQIPRDDHRDALDLGTGSGAIAIAVASERPNCQMVATDVSEQALAVARENVRVANLLNVDCRQGDWTAAVQGQQFDIVLSNPPYVGSNDAELAKLVFEPQSALVSGADGLNDIRRLVVDCIEITKADGRILLEHGSTQAEAVAALLANAGWLDISCHNDLAGLPRVTAARRGAK